MKHAYLNYIIAFLPAALLFACTPEKPSDKEILDSRTVSDLKVSYSLGGSELTVLNFTHFAGMKTIDVDLNDKNLVWNLVSNRDWCQVVSPAGKGPGKVILKVKANDGFEARDPATLTFVAGDFRGFNLSVSQSASAFSLSQPYFLSGPQAAEFEVSVTTLAGAQWDYTADPFLTVVPANPVPKGDYETSVLKIKAENNANPSRMGKVTLRCGEELEYIYLYQFGSEYSFDPEGRILLPGTASAVSVIIPEFIVSEVIAPQKMAEYVMSDPDNGYVTLTVKLAENLSDCAEKRDVAVSLRLSNASASLVDLPVLVQDYIPANGLVTYKGLQAFAAAVAAGESTADWETGGVVCMKGDIDMDGVTDWAGIGSADRPFSGKFDGGRHAILNLRAASHGLFNHCKDATVQNVSLSKGSSVVYKDAFGMKTCLGGIVSVAENSVIENCSLAGEISFAGTSDEEEPEAYVGGIVGWADAGTRINGGKLTGKVTVATPSATGMVCFLGGVAGLCEGGIAHAEVLGAVNFSSSIGTVYAGGVQARLVEGATVDGNSFMGTLSLGGNAGFAALGGLYGIVSSDRSFDSASDASVSLGNIQVDAYRSAASSCVYAGGFVGIADGGISLSFKGYSMQTNVRLDFSNPTPLTARNVCVGGLLGGCREDLPVAAVNFENVTSSGVISAAYSTAITCPVRRNWMGGIAGYVNGPSSFTKCVNEGEVGKYEGGAYCARSNGYGEICGGIAGYVHGGDAEFTDCTNKGDVLAQLYNNNGVTGVFDKMYTPIVAGGILGAFNYGTAIEKFRLSITDCSNTRNISTYRGYSGGIVGYCYNATLSGCNNLGRLSNGTNDVGAYRGGIAGAAGNATITGCDAVCDILSTVAGSADYACAGGILGLVRGDEPVALSGCRFFGSVKSSKGNTDKPECPGGIVGRGSEGTAITDCSYGGNIQGVEITENNVDTQTLVIGNGEGAVSGISYWAGK
jgi:hypothetical protein